MKAFFATSYGGPEVMRLGTLPDPTPKYGQVLVTVRAASVNPLDWKLRQGQLKLVTGWAFPKIFGADFSGIIQALGQGVTSLAVGDSVYGYTPIMFRKPGAHAQRVAVAAKRVHRLPVGLSFEQAAALPVAALTALNGLRQCGDLRGRTVMVNGATGGVGHFAVQIAKAKGATVSAVCSARNAERARALGADDVIDYRREDFTRQGETYDVICDAFGNLGFGAAARVLAGRGHYVTTLAMPPVIVRSLWKRLVGGKQIVLGNMRDRPEDYAELERLIHAGAVKPIVERIFPLDQAAQAFLALEKGGTVGKVVIRLNEDDV